MSEQVLAVIPARFASTRFPGKPLAPIAGRPMVLRVVERVRRAQSVGRVLVATDDERIFQAVSGAGGEAMMTRSDHCSGTERLAEVAGGLLASVYVNVQGDEPLIEPAAVDAVVEAILREPAVSVSTLAVAIREPRDALDPNIVKVVCDAAGDALYFSRAPIPHVRGDGAGFAPGATAHWKHLGIYAYRRDPLLEFPRLAPGRLERLEQLEQLRFLEHGYKIRVVETTHDAVSVDVPADVPRVEALLAERES